MALSPYINETVLTASIESVVPLDAQGILTQVIATSTYDLESGTHIYTVKVTDGVLQYQVGRKQAASASTCVGISFSGRDGTATFDITPTAEGHTYKATSITNFYGSVNSDATLVNKIYGSGPVEEKNLGTWQGNETTSFTMYLNFNIYIARTIRTNDSFRVIGKVGITYPNQASASYAEIYNDLNAEINGSDFHIYTARTKVYGDGGDGTTSALTTDFDVTIPLASGTSTYTFDVVIKDTSHRKTLSCMLDSSEAGATLIHQGFGHFPYYGQIVYYTDAGHTATGVILLKNQSQIDQLHGNWQGWETEIEGVQLNSADIKEVYIGKQAESIPHGFMIGCSSIDTVDLSESEITSIPGNFMKDCSNFNGTLKLPPTTQTIGSLFLYEANHFNQPLTIPTGVTSINHNFLYNASDFNQPITLPPSLVSLGYQFLYGCNKMTSTVNVGSLSADIATYNDRTLATNSSSAAMYRTGVTIAGANRAAWLAKFPNNNSVPFRKLVDAGY